ncbi:hypothetical protein BK139_12015 [Paenibacillus sp. FSL R5-0490]|nr:hypothetical protein BK139_12015 [Paenibacillus sp. FSL R5-0490]
MSDMDREFLLFTLSAHKSLLCAHKKIYPQVNGPDPQIKFHYPHINLKNFLNLSLNFKKILKIRRFHHKK